MSVVIEFSVPFVAGLERPRITAHGGFPRMHDTDANQANKAHIRAAWRNACVRRYGFPVYAGAHEPVRLTLDVWAPMPPSVRPKSLLSQPNTFKPDIDNALKLVLDAGNPTKSDPLGFWHDDCQVTEVTVRKHDRVRGASPHMDIRIEF